MHYAHTDLFAMVEPDRVAEMPELGLRYYQQEAREAVARVHEAHRGALVVLPTGCHRAGQLIMRHSGQLAKVEDIIPGDLLMGPDGAPRTVLQLARGNDQMVEIRPVKGEPWVVNYDHVLTLVSTCGGAFPSERGGVIVDVSVRDWLDWSRNRKHLHKLFRTAVSFPDQPDTTVTPYMLGVLLGDGALTKFHVTVTKPDKEIRDACAVEADRYGVDLRVTDNGVKCPVYSFARRDKRRPNPLAIDMRDLGLLPIACEDRFIPDRYKLGSIDVRRDVLAGLMDTDGSLTTGGFDYISKSPRLAYDVAFVARSLGIAAYVSECKKGCQGGFVGTYYRVSISGDCDQLPTRIPHKKAPPRRQKKSPLRTGFGVVPTGSTEPYYGFALDGDQRYLLGDFTVTHNTGKSRLLGAITWDGHVRHQRTLVLCPTITLVRQMYSDLRKLGLNVEMEQASNHARRPLPPVVVACVASMRGDRLASFSPYDFDRIGVDEAHRCISPLYAAIFAHFSAAKLIGLTATPSRSDGVSLGNVFEETAYTMTMLRAISEGWLVPLRFKTAVTDFDPKALRTLAGEVDPSSVAAEITRSGLLHEAANTLAELSAGERTVAFLPTVASSKAFVAELIARGIEAAHVDASTPEQARNEMFAAFAAGTIRVIANVGILCEGWDMPACSVVALLNPTKSWQRLTQMIGRITRLAHGKEFGLVLDFCPGRLRKGRLASPADALSGKMLDDAVHDQLAVEGDLATAIADAETSAAEIEEKKRKALEKAEARRQRVRELAELARKKKYRYGVQDHDAAAILGGSGGDQPGEMRSHNVEPSEDDLRKAAGICSVKQSHILRRWGLNPRMSRTLAGEVMGALSETNWQVLPDRIKQDPRFRAAT